MTEIQLSNFRLECLQQHSFFSFDVSLNHVLLLHTINLLEILNALPFHIYLFLLDEDKPNYYETTGMAEMDVICSLKHKRQWILDKLIQLWRYGFTIGMYLVRKSTELLLQQLEFLFVMLSFSILSKFGSISSGFRN